MLIRLPQKIRVLHAACFALTLALVELMQGSDPVCVVYVCGFIMAATFGFNKVGGLKWPTGGFIFFYALLTLIVGVVWKAVLGEPVDSNLHYPQKTFAVYMVGMAVLSFTAVLVSYMRPKKPLIDGYIAPEDAEHAAMGCLIVAAGIVLMTFVLPPSSVMSFILQIDHFQELTLLIAVYYRVRATGGRSVVSPSAVISFTALFLFSLITFSKQAMFVPFVCVILSASAIGYWISLKRLAATLVLLAAAFYVLVPYAQYGRNHREEFPNPVDALVMLVTHPTAIRDKLDELEAVGRPAKFQYFTEKQAGMERLTMLTLDDPLIEISDKGQTMGLEYSWVYVLNSIPRFLLPDKPNTGSGNLYAHQLGVLSENDVTTGISFSGAAEAYHIGRWLGLFLALPAFAFVGLWASDAMTGSSDDGPWALLYILTWAHFGPEGGMGAFLYVAAQGTFGVVVMTLFVTKLAPALGSLVLGPSRRGDTKIAEAVAHLPHRNRGVVTQ